MSGFYNQLDDVLSTEVMAPFAEPAQAPTRLIAPLVIGNGLEGHSYGAELSADVRPAPWWRWTSHYSLLRIQLSKQPGSVDASQERRNEGLSPRHQLQLQSSWDLPGLWSVDALARHVSALTAGPVPSYTTADLRLAYQATSELEVALVSQNLLQGRHLEWAGAAGNSVEIRRSAYIKVTWRAAQAGQIRRAVGPGA
jgi:iron complex outermembrane receptor protein